MEGVCHKAVSHMLQGQGEQKVFVVREIHIYYKERGIEDVCHRRISHTCMLQGENVRCLA